MRWSSPLLVALLAGVTAIGCVAAAPRELLDARSAYREASAGDVPELAPGELRVAENALAHAERAFERDGVEPYVVNLAYIAQRRAEFASAQAKLREAARWQQVAQSEIVAAALARDSQDASLALVSATYREQPGLTLSVDAGDAQLPDPEQKMLTVDLLTRQPGATVMVEGHTDAAGEASWNQWLSEQRAKVVRDH